jgi:hypothetical protein
MLYIEPVAKSGEKTKGSMMAHEQKILKLDAVPAQIREPLQLFAEKLRQGLSNNLRSITVVGSSLTDDYRPARSDINTVLVLNEQTLRCLNEIAGLAKPMSKKKISAPLLMTSSYIERSRDVFGVELLDLQLTHRTILGDDPFAQLTFDKKDVRLQCERELKAMLIRLRQGYIAAAGKKKLVHDVLIATAKALAPLLRAMLWLKDIDRPRTAAQTFTRAGAELSTNLDALAAVREAQYEKLRLSEAQMEETFDTVYRTVDQLSLVVDKLEV